MVSCWCKGLPWAMIAGRAHFVNCLWNCSASFPILPVVIRPERASALLAAAQFWIPYIHGLSRFSAGAIFPIYSLLSWVELQWISFWPSTVGKFLNSYIGSDRSSKFLKAPAPRIVKLPEGVANCFPAFCLVNCLNIEILAVNNNFWQLGGSSIPVGKASGICCTLPLYQSGTFYFGAIDLLHGIV